MNNLYFPRLNSNIPIEEDSTISSPNIIKSSIITKNLNNSFEPFKAFSSALFMSEYQENADTLISSNSKSNSSKVQKNKKILDLNISPSLEKCLTNELLESMADDSSNIKLSKNSSNNNIENNEPENLKITKKLFEQNKPSINNEKNGNPKYNIVMNKDKTTLYEDDTEYQLKYIEHSVHNILPKSYKKFNNNKRNNFNNNNFGYNNKNYNHRSSFPYSNKYKNNYSKNSNENCDSSNRKTNSVNIFYPDLIDKNEDEIRENDFYSNNNVKNHIIYKVQNMKFNDKDYDDWICNKCSFLNRGYRKICANCNIHRKK